MTVMSMDELNQKLTAVVDDYIAAATAAQQAYNTGLWEVFAAAQAANIDDRLLSAVVHAQMQRMEQALSQALTQLGEAT